MRYIARHLITFLLRFDKDIIYFAPGQYRMMSRTIELSEGQRMVGA